jgi:hypothetical protein
MAASGLQGMQSPAPNESRAKTPKELSITRRRVATRNLEQCLAGLDKNGQAGLQSELDRMYPGAAASPRPTTPRRWRRE